MNTIIHKTGGSTKLRYRLLCMKEKQEELLARIESLIEQRDECCAIANYGISLLGENVTLELDEVTLA